MESLRIDMRKRKLNNITICVLIVSQPLARVDPDQLAAIRALFGVPPDAQEIYRDKAIFKNTVISWPEAPRQMVLPL